MIQFLSPQSPPFHGSLQFWKQEKVARVQVWWIRCCYWQKNCEQAMTYKLTLFCGAITMSWCLERAPTTICITRHRITRRTLNTGSFFRYQIAKHTETRVTFESVKNKLKTQNSWQCQHMFCTCVPT